VVNYDSQPKQVAVTLDCPAPSAAAAVSLPPGCVNNGGGGRRVALAADARWVVLTSGSPKDGNSYEAPLKVSPKERPLRLAAPGDGSFSLAVAPWSVNIVVLTSARQQ
jgi:hypothetical protein